MEFTVKLFATLREGRGKILNLSMPQGSCVADVLAALKIDHDEVTMLLVNGHDKSLDSMLEDGDTLSLFPPVGGG